VYEEAVGRTTVEVERRTAILAEVETALKAKAHDPSRSPESPDLSALADALAITVLAGAVTEHNDRAHRHEDLTAEYKATVLNHLVGSQSTAFRDLEQQVADAQAKSQTSDKAVVLAERRLNEVRQEQFTTKDMADTLTRDLARVYGKNHLSVAVTEDGKSYSCRRGAQAATDLSVGERTTLSLLYFLRKLEDEQVQGGDPSGRIVVVDDPSSSLDREALFATHQWLSDTLRGFGQYIILTHDFSLLLLFINSHRNAWGDSMKRIREGNADEIRFPRVSFLEMFAVNVDGERASRVGQLPQLLINNTSEYAYLFSMVMAGIADTEDHERLFLLPNAARRVLEVFASYKAPHRTNLDQKLQSLIEALESEPYRDVYDFCNRHSHGDGSESVDVLDARAVHGQIRRCMEFLRAVDSEHFERMCNATGIEPGTLP
jgi:wobble nucleotide-excising tRNase